MTFLHMTRPLPILGIGFVVVLGVLAVVLGGALDGGDGEPVDLTAPRDGGENQVVEVPDLTATPIVIATAAPTPPDSPAPTPERRKLEIITILPKDAIPAILNPTFVSMEVADGRFGDLELVLGLSVNGEHRAYSTSQLSSREIVNDTVGGVPVAVTW